MSSVRSGSLRIRSANRGKIAGAALQRQKVTTQEPPKSPAVKKRKKPEAEAPPKRAVRRKTEKKSQSEKDIEDAKNNDYCDACGGLGRFLCCDACPKAFHFTCMEPPMEEEEVERIEGQWFCNECQNKQDNNTISDSDSGSGSGSGSGSITISDKRSSERYRKNGLFEALLQDLKGRNPKAFSLPKEIRTFFTGVSANSLGEYVDSTTVKAVRYRNGQREEPDYRQLKDKNGKFIVCYKCRKTAVSAPIVGCDYCPLYWHMDCLDPPMCIPPNISRKWMCPNHAEHVMPKRRIQRRPLIIEPKFPQSTNNGDIEIVSDDSTDSIDTLDDMDSFDQLASCGGVVYRLPAKAIQTDFMEYAKSLRHAHQRSTTAETLSKATSPLSHPSPEPFLPSPQTLDGSQDPTDKATEGEAKEWLESLLFFQTSGEEYQKHNNDHDHDHDHDQKNDLSHDHDFNYQQPEQGMDESSEQNTNVDQVGLHALLHAIFHDKYDKQDDTPKSKRRKVEIDQDRYEKCLRIEELLRRKGEEALMKILTTTD
ncbi:hypothetical protein J3Q64DRAFT_1722848 [Phycomyces blakesleeanus]|uniref:PHD-type domain-containing protein n=1 Tax=Phycomyces blakesleeanus TaxID=4837 RepID=A0ABR3BCK0_PHYBL